MITVVCFKFQDPNGRYNHFVRYTNDHVHKLKRMLARHLRTPHQLMCITDDPSGLDPDIITAPVNPLLMSYGGLWVKLQLFSEKRWPSNRLLYSDLDCVILGDITPMVDRGEDIVLWKKPQVRYPYNASMILYTPGTRPQVMGQFDIDWCRVHIHPKAMDQGWLATVLGPDVAGFDPSPVKFDPSMDGKPAASIVYFAGYHDPSIYQHYDWVKENWK